MAILDMYNEDVISRFVPLFLRDHYRNGGRIIEQYHLCQECAYLLKDLAPSKWEHSYKDVSPPLFCKNCTVALCEIDDEEYTDS